MNEDRREMLLAHPFLAGCPLEAIERLADYAERRRFASGELLLREGGSEEDVYLLVRGRVSIEVHAPERGPLIIETIEPDGVVGLSWAAPPYRARFDCRAVNPVEAVALDTVRLRAHLEEDVEFAALFLDRLAAVILDRLQATRFRLLDLYGATGA